MEKSIYDLKLHETILVKTVDAEKGGSVISFRVTRVHGGWIYRNTYENSNSIAFVPFPDAKDPAGIE